MGMNHALIRETERFERCAFARGERDPVLTELRKRVVESTQQFNLAKGVDFDGPLRMMIEAQDSLLGYSMARNASR